MSQVIDSRNSSLNFTAFVDQELRQLGYEMGVLSATYWASVKDSERFRYMTIADYRDAGAADSVKSLANEAHADDFITGFHMGFDDEAFDRAEAGIEGFEDVFTAGSVDGSIAVTARRLLKLLDGVRLSD
jgi:hypothetical protein